MENSNGLYGNVKNISAVISTMVFNVKLITDYGRLSDKKLLKVTLCSNSENYIVTCSFI